MPDVGTGSNNYWNDPANGYGGSNPWAGFSTWDDYIAMLNGNNNLSGNNSNYGDPVTLPPFVVNGDPWSPGYLGTGSTGFTGTNFGGGAVGGGFGSGGGTYSTPLTGIYQGDPNDPIVAALKAEENRRAAAGLPPMNPDERNSLIDRVSQQTYNPNPNGVSFDPSHGSLGSNNQTTYPSVGTQIGTPIPLPVNLPTAIGATIILDQTGIFGGGGGGGSSGGGGSGATTGGNMGSGVNSDMGPQQVTTLPIYPTGSGPNSPIGADTGPKQSIPQANTPIAPMGGGDSAPNNSGVVIPQTNSPLAPYGGGDTTTNSPTTPIVPDFSGNANNDNWKRPPQVFVPNSPNGTIPTPIPEPKTPTTTNPVIPTGGGGGATGGGTSSITPTIMPSFFGTPFNTTAGTTYGRNFLTEGTQTAGDLRSILPSIFSQYGGYAGNQTTDDLNRYYNAVSTGQFGQANQNLTGIAGQQTAAANTQLRQGNLSDAEALAQRALALRQQTNAGLYGGIDQFNQTASGQVTNDLARLQQAQARQLSPEDTRNAQQAAREAYAARGLVMGKGAIGAEILNRDALARQREQEARTNLGTSMGQLYQGIGANTANVFDPMAATLGSQYGMQTSNVGLNQALANQGMGLTSGAYGNQYVQGITNPFSPYAQDVYGTNVNAANSASINAMNRQTALEAAKAGQTAAYTQLFGQFAGSPLGQDLGRSLLNNVFGWKL